MIGVVAKSVDHSNSKPEGVAGRDYVSWSQLSTFRQCPLRYQFRYLDRVEPEFVSSALLVGSSLHAAFEHHHRHQLETDDTVSLDELLETFWSDWKHRVEESPEVRFNKKEDINSVGQLADRMLRAFLESTFAESPGIIIGIEESMRYSVVPGRPEFLGIVDLVFMRGDRLIIRDYKSSRSKWNQGNAESSADQLLLYSELAVKKSMQHSICQLPDRIDVLFLVESHLR
jgi:ATP-dependent exoDNAse (exonuclease V) beta subunit